MTLDRSTEDPEALVPVVGIVLTMDRVPGSVFENMVVGSPITKYTSSNHSKASCHQEGHQEGLSCCRRDFSS